MSPEPVGLGRMKQSVVRVLEDAIGLGKTGCHAMPEGATVRVDHDTAHEPKTLVSCGPALPNDAIEIPNPVIVVEVPSPSMRCIDASTKLMGYFKLPSVQHYLIVDTDKLPVLHHQRQSENTILTHIIHDGLIAFDPPGITISVASLFPE